MDRIYVESEGAYLPEGFKYLEGTKKDGLVIQNKKTQDEFVWIPVETPVLDLSSSNSGSLTDDIIKKAVEDEISIENYPMAIKKDEENYIGVLYDFSLDSHKQQVKIEPFNKWEPTSNNSGYREPDVITNDTNKNITQENLQKEYNELVESVKQNGGFYIGRYESSVENDKVVSKKRKESYG